MDKSRLRQRTEPRSAADIVSGRSLRQDNSQSESAAIKALSNTKAPSRRLPHEHGFHELSKQDIKKDLKDIDINRAFACYDDDDNTYSHVHFDPRPSVPEGSTAFQKCQRFRNWIKDPDKVEPEVHAYERSAANAKKAFMKLESDYESWLHDFAASRQILSDAMNHCTRDNERLKVAAKMMSDKCSQELYSKKSRSSIPFKDMLEALEGRDEELIEKMMEYEALIKEYALSNKQVAAIVTSIDIDEVDYPLECIINNGHNTGAVDSSTAEPLGEQRAADASSSGATAVESDRKRSTRVKSATKRDCDDLSTSYVNRNNNSTVPDINETVTEEQDEGSKYGDDIDLYRTCRLLEDAVRASENSIGDIACFFNKKRSVTAAASSSSGGSRSNISSKNVGRSSDDDGSDNEDDNGDDRNNSNNGSSYLSFDIREADRGVITDLLNCGRDEHKWTKRLNSHIAQSETSGRARRSTSTLKTINLRTHFTGRTPYGVPLLLGPSSVYTDGFIGSLEGGRRSACAPSVNPPAEILRMDEEVRERAHLQSSAASAATKLQKIRHFNSEWTKQLLDSKPALQNAELRIEVAKNLMAEEARCMTKELVLAGLVSIDTPLSPLVQWPRHSDGLAAPAKVAHSKKKKGGNSSGKSNALFPANPPLSTPPVMPSSNHNNESAISSAIIQIEPVSEAKSNGNGHSKESKDECGSAPPAKKGRWAGHVKKG